MPPVGFSGVDFRSNDFVANDVLAGNIAGIVDRFLASRNAAAAYDQTTLDNEYKKRQTLEEYARPGGIDVTLQAAPGPVPGLPATPPPDFGGGYDPAALVMARAGLPAMETPPLAAPQLPASIPDGPLAAPAGAAPAPVADGSASMSMQTVSPGEGLPDLPADAPPPPDGFDTAFEGARDVSQKTKQDIAAFIGQHGLAAEDALAQHARFTPEEIANARDGKYTPLMVMKLGEVPGGRIQSLPGTKTRERMEDKQALEYAKLAARINKDAQSLQGKADDRAIKLYKIVTSNTLDVMKQADFSALLNTDPTKVKSSDELQAKLANLATPQFKELAHGMKLDVNDPVLDKYIDSVSDELADQLKTRAGSEGSGFTQKAAKIAAAVKKSILENVNSPDAIGNGKASEAAKAKAAKEVADADRASTVAEAKKSVAALIEQGKAKTRAEAIQMVLNTQAAKKAGVKASDL